MDIQLAKGLKNLIKYSKGSKEISLIVAKDVKSQKKLTSQLKDQHFSYISSFKTLPFAITHHTKVIVDLNKIIKNQPKLAYDFISQYSSGSVQIVDPKDFTSQIIDTPSMDHCVVAIISEKELKKLQKTWQILDKIGMVWRQQTTKAQMI